MLLIPPGNVNFAIFLFLTVSNVIIAVTALLVSILVTQ